MEPSLKNQKIEAMKSYKRAKIFYNLVLYSLTSVITCFFFSSPFWFPSITNHLLSSIHDKVSSCFNAKCFFIVGNLIVIILVGESKLKQSSTSRTSDFYDEYVARSRSNLHKVTIGVEKSLVVEEKIHHHEVKNSTIMPHGEGKKMGMSSSRSEVLGESGMVKVEKARVKKEEQFHDGAKVKTGMRSSKSAVWGECGMVKMEKSKVKKVEEKRKYQFHEGEKVKTGMRSSKSAVWGEGGMVKTAKSKVKKEEQFQFQDGEKMKMGMRSSKSAVWSENERVKLEKGKSEKEEQVNKKSGDEEAKEMAIVVWGKNENNIVEMENARGKRDEDGEKKMGMRSCRSAVWGDSSDQIVEREKAKDSLSDIEEKKMGVMRSSKSEIWSGSEMKRLGKTVVKEEEEQELNMLNKRVEDFIARVNKQRLLV